MRNAALLQLLLLVLWLLVRLPVASVAQACFISKFFDTVTPTHLGVAGLENGVECWCTDYLDDAGVGVPVNLSQCNQPCEGNPAESCGAASRLAEIRFNCESSRRWGCVAGQCTLSASGTYTNPVCNGTCQPPAPNDIIMPADLRTDYNETAYAEAAPNLCWRPVAATPAARAQFQTGYRIEVKLPDATSSLWDTGQVVDNSTICRRYAGPALQSDQLYQWRVRLWSASGAESPPSDWSAFHTALLNPATDWSPAVWISSNDNTANIYRTEFTLRDVSISRATLYYIPLGYGRALINGIDVAPTNYLGPWTTWSKRLLYQAVNVTALLHQNQRHALAFMLGNGQYNSIWTHAWSPSTPTKALIAQLVVHYANGDSQTVSSTADSSWQTTKGPITFDDIYAGETFDARLVQDGWLQPNFANGSRWQTPAAWQMSRVLRGNPVLSLDIFTPIRIVATRAPVRLTQPKTNTFVVHFAENFVGVTTLRVKGQAGVRVAMAHGEQLMLANGTACLVDCREYGAVESGRVYYPFKGAVASFVLRGTGQEESFQPLFTYYGYQFVEVTWSGGSIEQLTLDSFQGLVVHSDVRPVGTLSFPVESDILNGIDDIRKRSLLSNMHSVESDCPTRERVGWTGDAQATAESAVHDFDMAGFWSKWVQDMVDAQAADGGLSSTVPYAKHAPPVDPTWPTAFPQLQALLWSYYGLLSVPAVNAAARYVDYVGNVKSCPSCKVPTPTQHDGLVDFYMNGDWMAYMSQDDELKLSGPPMSSLHYIWDLELVGYLLGAARNDSGAAGYAAKAAALVPKFTDLYYSGGSYGSLQTVNAAALVRGFVGSAEVGTVAAALARLVASADHHATTGFVGNKYVYHALTLSGYGAEALKLALQDTVPSYGYQVKQGATTLWEDWSGIPDETNANGAPSHNHHFLGAIGQWFYQALLGVQLMPLELVGWDSGGLPGSSAVAFGQVVLRPEVIGQAGLSGAKGSVATWRGEVAVAWLNVSTARQQCGGSGGWRWGGGGSKAWSACEQSGKVPAGVSFTLSASIPVNVVASVHVPCGGPEGAYTVQEGGVVVWANGQFAGGVAGVVAGARNVTAAHGCRVVLTVQSGDYDFAVVVG